MTVLRIVSWNIGRSKATRDSLRESNFDIALLQEAPLPEESWERINYDRGADIVKLSDRADVQKFTTIPQGSRQPKRDEISVSAPGTIAAARVNTKNYVPFIVVSIYARWERPHPATSTKWFVGFADAMAHRAISDLSTFIGDIDPTSHRILVAGDFNLIHGALDSNRLALPARDRSVFERFEALGFEYVGPISPNGRQADPTPAGLPKDTKNVPTFYTTHQKNAENAANQLDYVFASRGFHESVSVRALNGIEEWGSSDHCRISIEIDPSS